MLNILRAFAWMRWRVFVNSLQHTSARDTLERFSVAIEEIGPLLAAALLIPSTIALVGFGVYAGYAQAVHPAPVAFELIRFILLAPIVLCALGPVVMPGGERISAVRLLLLPIPRSTLYVAQTAGTLGDPWVLLTVPLLVSIPIGLAIGGAWSAAAISLASGAFFLLVIVGVSSLAACAVQLVLRDRRRGELLTLLFVLVLPAIWMLPSLTGRQHESPREATRSAARERQWSTWIEKAVVRTWRVSPSEMYVDATRSGARHDTPRAGLAAAALLGTGVVLHSLALLTFVRLLDSPGIASGRRVATTSVVIGRKLPGLSAAASAVALAQLRLAMRTPRGRSIFLSPVVVFVMFAVLIRHAGSVDAGLFRLYGGLALATFGSFVCLFAILPLAMNQFAIDGAGLTLELLAPIEASELLAGKAVASAAIAAAPAALCWAVTYVLFRGDGGVLWLAIPPAIAATYLLVAPAAAALSAVFPRAVDMNSIGSGSNSHGLAGLLGLVSFLIAGLPSLALTLVAATLLHRPVLAPLLLTLWCGISFVIARLLFRPVARLFESRRENLGLVVE